MDGEVTGMPKFQLIRDFFLGLDGPYKVLTLDDKGKVERVGRLKALHSVVTVEEYKPIIAEFIKYARQLQNPSFARLTGQAA